MPRHTRRRESSRRAAEDGQALVEFSIVGGFFVLLVLGIINFGYTYEKKIIVATAANNGARYGATHATSLSNAAAPNADTIQGVVRATSPSLTIPNTDTNILVRYYKLAAGLTLCGTYTVAGAGSVTYVAGYNSGNCGVQDDVVDVKVSVTSVFAAPILTDLFKNGITLTNEVAIVIAS